MYLLGIAGVAMTSNTQQIILAHPIVAEQVVTIHTANRVVKHKNYEPQGRPLDKKVVIALDETFLGVKFQVQANNRRR